MSGGFRVGHMEVVAATALGERQDKLGWREFLGLRKMRVSMISGFYFRVSYV